MWVENRWVEDREPVLLLPYVENKFSLMLSRMLQYMENREIGIPTKVFVLSGKPVEIVEPDFTGSIEVTENIPGTLLAGSYRVFAVCNTKDIHTQFRIVHELTTANRNSMNVPLCGSSKQAPVNVTFVEVRNDGVQLLAKV